MNRINRFMRSDNRAKFVAMVGMGIIFLVCNYLIEDSHTFTTIAYTLALLWFLICVCWSAALRPIHEDD